MDRSTFESADPILDEIATTIDEFLDSDQFSAVRNALAIVRCVASLRRSSP
jgi:hypothetical protein